MVRQLPSLSALSPTPAKPPPVPLVAAPSTHASPHPSPYAVVGGGQQIVRMSELPLTHLLFLPDGCMVGVGHCYDPILFVRTGDGWKVAGKLEGGKKEAVSQGGFASARSMFQERSKMGQSSGAAAADKLDSIHTNQVCGLQLFGGSFGGTAAEFTTSALDGKMAFWTRDSISAAMSSLTMDVS